MTIKPVTFYVAECDLCGSRDDQGYDYAAWSDENGAEESVVESEWHVEGGNHLCPDCIPTSPEDDLDSDQMGVR